jgi:hypothetical protein
VSGDDSGVQFKVDLLSVIIGFGKMVLARVECQSIQKHRPEFEPEVSPIILKKPCRIAGEIRTWD